MDNEFYTVYCAACAQLGLQPLPINSRTELATILPAAEECYGDEVSIGSKAASWLQ
jgi:hypothetical protein